MLEDCFPLLVYALLAAAIPATMIAFSFLFATRPTNRVNARMLPFESGVSEGPPKQQRFTVSFYLTAMLFILFDIEIVFLYPLAIVLERSAGSAWRVPRLRRHPRRRVRLHLAEGSARVALDESVDQSRVSDRPLAKAGLQSERLLWPTKARASSRRRSSRSRTRSG